MGVMQSTVDTSQSNANRQIARAAGTVMVAMIISQVVGLVKNILIAHAFGTGIENEAFFAANRFTDILYNLVAGGALGSAFIPTFTTLLTQNARSRAWKLASSVANLVTLILTLLGTATFIFAPWVVENILAPGFKGNAELMLMTVRLLRLQLPAPVLFGISGLLMGILNAHQSFLFPALAPAMYSLGTIFGVLVLVPRMGVSGLGVGVVMGALLHLLVQAPAWLKLPERSYRLMLGLNLAEVREVARLMAPRLLGVAAVQLNFLINTRLASAQGEGSLTGISLAFPLMIMPQAAIAQSIAIAALPTFSAQIAGGKKDEMRSSLAATLRGILLLALPATVGLIMLRVPLVTFLFKGDVFTQDSVMLVAWALLWYAAGLVGHSVVEIVSRAFYALHDTRTPVILGVLAMSLNVGLSYLFSALFARLGWMPHGGLALANSLATALEMVALLLVMRKRLGGLEGGRVWKAAGQGLMGAGLMGAALWGWIMLTMTASPAIVVTGGVVVGGLAYGAILMLLKVPEVRLGIEFFRSKLRVRRID